MTAPMLVTRNAEALYTVTSSDAALLEACVEAADALREYCRQFAPSEPDCGEADCENCKEARVLRATFEAYDEARAKVGGKPYRAVRRARSRNEND